MSLADPSTTRKDTDLATMRRFYVSPAALAFLQLGPVVGRCPHCTICLRYVETATRANVWTSCAACGDYSLLPAPLALRLIADYRKEVLL